MRAKEFNELIKTDNPKHIIFLHTTWKIFLNSKQIEKILKLKGEKKNGDRNE